MAKPLTLADKIHNFACYGVIHSNEKSTRDLGALFIFPECNFEDVRQ